MGLGKTIQALAHVLIEKRSGRLTAPVLVVAPTSLMFSWQAEAERFCPELSVLLWHGVERKKKHGLTDDFDIVLTTYAVLRVDAASFQKREFHYVVLDEAQAIKNPKSLIAQVVRGLSARHRLCMTGTPLENHLGELWAQFDFLMPGFLGDARQFHRLYRNPIERHGDIVRQAGLARRIKPFLMRRTKNEVAKELPPKTEMIRKACLKGPQRDLYESIRLAMYKRVRKAIAEKGAARSHIIMLDALLKLRQVCCHPGLLDLEVTKTKLHGSAKLDLLMDMLPNLLEEGRAVLLISQFTSMLERIEKRVTKAGLDYVKLTGSTRNRQRPVERFQAGEVSLFLISLKAGGVGLNLTAADTVIHYDPWWNPAVENQATDRAHRIGQDKPVFVYKLIAEHTVEEKIIEMQAKKQALADGVLSGANGAEAALTADDIAYLLNDT